MPKRIGRALLNLGWWLIAKSRGRTPEPTDGFPYGQHTFGRKFYGKYVGTVGGGAPGTRLPTVGGDLDLWGDILSDFLSQGHASDGVTKLKSFTKAGLPAAGIAGRLALVTDGGTPGNIVEDNGLNWRSIYSRNTKVIVVTDPQFGAKADGSDDSVALQAAFNAAVNGKIIIPNGTYKHASTINIVGPVDIEFQSAGAVFEYTGTGDAITIINQRDINWWSGKLDLRTSAGLTATALHIQGLWFGMFYAPHVATLNQQTGYFIEDGTGAGNPFGAFIIQIINPRFQYGSGTYGIRTRGVTTSRVTHLVVRGGWISGYDYGLYIDNVHGGKFEDMAIDDGIDGIFVQNSSDLVLAPGETGSLTGFQINYGTGNAAILEMPTNSSGSSYGGNFAIFTPNIFQRNTFRQYASRTDQTYFYELRSIFDNSKSFTLTVRGGSLAAREILRYREGPVVTSDSQFGAVFGFTERNRVTPIGEWISPIFNAGDFTASGLMTWTVESGDVLTYRYTLAGSTMILSFVIDTTTVGGTLSDALKIKVPGGFAPNKKAVNPVYLSNNGTESIGIATVSDGVTDISITLVPSANFAASTNGTSIRGQVTLEIQL